MQSETIPNIRVPETVSLAFETNGKGHIGYIVELPGAFVRGATEEGALAKVDNEVRAYLRWLQIEVPDRNIRCKVVQRHHSSLMVEDADNGILLDNDKGEVASEEFKDLAEIVRFSGETFYKTYDAAQFKGWIDVARIRKTFHGQNPKTIQEVFDHVNNCQYYYLSRTLIALEKKESEFLRIRNLCLERLQELHQENNNLRVFESEGESWTLKKILRRFVWHDRIHGKAMVRILEKQRQLGLIDSYEDYFRFKEGAV